MRIYTEDGYLNIETMINTKLPFLFIVGGRGTGKTYGALKYVVEHNIKFILMRRTQSQVDLINKPEFSPFKALNDDGICDIGSMSLSKYNVGFYHMEESAEGKAVPSGPAIGYSMALSTISNLRGFDASDCRILIFDEFIPERHERTIKEEGAAFLNAYETINRNRELKGEDPLQVIGLANANDMGNPIFMELGLISKVENMKKKHQSYSLDYNRGIGIFLLEDSPISAKKQNTALYKIAAQDFKEMAIMNDFEELKTDLIKSRPIKEFTPIVTIGELTFYKHKSNKTYYCTTMRIGDPESYTVSDMDLKRFFRKYAYLWTAYLKNNLYFEDATCEIIFKKYAG